MLAALTRLMTAESPREERRRSPEPGYATFDHLLTAMQQQTEAFTRGLADVRETMRHENATTRALVETYRAETSRRLDVLEQWRDEEEVAEAVRNGRLAIFLLSFRWLTQHWQVVWAIVALLLGSLWTVAGNAPLGIGPVEAP